MAKLGWLVVSLSLFVLVTDLCEAISSCNGPCKTLNDCDGQLICIRGKCDDDPDVGSHVCSNGGGGGGSSPPSGNSCQPFSHKVCKGTSHPQYKCSPPVTSSTRAILTNNDFSQGGDGGGPSECDDKFHSNSELIVALSTGWYNRGSRCGKKIKITARNGKSVLAKVVDECDSINGCDTEHAQQPPCRNNIVDASNAVWDALGLDIDVGEEPINWSDVN
ncbi:hypothetical protein IC582_026777 [Cucumis melo]|uniref:Kiwellin-like n=2 Tax=Cucumis melo TaxID=3656 RepID=A0A1S3CQ82_CUCME|nr:kiwellin-like [Cucumis melo]KAA0035244.1 kiwellin-like [Cucumis melo var. makuwa]TYK22399.1 kiwellin-like [Cucumis melo var. makuwa]